MNKSIATILFCLLATLVTYGASATVPDLLPVQGVLADDMGEPIDGQMDLTFSVYELKESETPVWTDTFTAVNVEDGFFTVYLGSNAVLDFASLTTSNTLWLGITVANDTEMERFQFASVPFALEAQVCQAVGSLTEGDINSNFMSSSYVPDWAELTGIPAGFADGTDDGFTTEAELTDLLDDNYVSSSAPAAGITITNIDNWNTAHGWGDHALAGYVETETDPVFGASVAAGVDADNVANWNSAYGWGDHDGLYAPVSHNHDDLYYTETELQTSGSAQVHWDNVTNVPAGIADGTDEVLNSGLEYAAGNQNLSVSSSGVTARSVEVTIPEDGYVKVDASAYVEFPSAGEDIIQCSINDSAALDTSHLVSVGDHNNSDTLEVFDDISSTRVFTVSAGTQTYYFFCACYRGTCRISDTSINALFIPNRY